MVDNLDNLDNLGYFATNPSDGAAGSLAPPPLIARFNPARFIDDALWEDDEGRIRRLIELGGVDGRMTYTFHIDRREHACTFEGLSAVALAMLSDCKRGLVDDDIPDREGEVRNLLLFDGVAPFEGPQDQEGNTLLHLVCAPKVAGWLMDRGLSLDAINNDGQTPLEYQAMPEDVRAFIEQKVLDDGLKAAASDEGQGGRARQAPPLIRSLDHRRPVGLWVIQMERPVGTGSLNDRFARSPGLLPTPRHKFV
jgi:hypothetical protein